MVRRARSSRRRPPRGQAPSARRRPLEARLRAHRLVHELAEHRGRILFFPVTAESLQAATDDFAPPTYPDEIELQELAAALECTRRLMLPERFRAMDRREAARRLQRLKA